MMNSTVRSIVQARLTTVVADPAYCDLNVRIALPEVDYRGVDFNDQKIEEALNQALKNLARATHKPLKEVSENLASMCYHLAATVDSLKIGDSANAKLEFEKFENIFHHTKEIFGDIRGRYDGIFLRCPEGSHPAHGTHREFLRKIDQSVRDKVWYHVYPDGTRKLSLDTIKVKLLQTLATTSDLYDYSKLVK